MSIYEEDTEEMLMRKVKRFGVSSHIPLPRKHLFKTARIFIKKIKCSKCGEIIEQLDSPDQKICNKCLFKF